MEKCIGQHISCKQGISGSILEQNETLPRLPTRIIKIETNGDDGIRARLICTEGLTGHYFTLSHRWGSYQPIATTHSTLTRFQAQLPVETMNPTFRDAISMTFLLGFQYLWIDALCIVQDDPEDWQREAKDMGRIFEEATCMLAAVDKVTDGQQDLGLFQYLHRGPPVASHFCPVESLWASENREMKRFIGHYWFPEPTAAHELRFRARTPQGWYIVNKSAWYKRGWIVQERTLARRTIYFTIDKLWWDCKQVQEDEDGYAYDFPVPARAMHVPYSPLNGHMSIDTVANIWETLVQDYSSCELSKDTDKAFAISGITQRLESRHKVQIGHGVIYDFTGRSLLWRASRANLKEY